MENDLSLPRLCPEDKYHVAILYMYFYFLHLVTIVLCSFRTLHFIILLIRGNSLGGQVNTSAVTLILLLTYGFEFLTRT